MTYGDVRKIETQISNLKAHSDPSVRALAKDLGNSVDEFMHTAKPTIPASSVGVVGPDDLDKAKDLWRRGSQANKVEVLAEKGIRTATNPTNKVAKNFEKYSDRFLDKTKYNPNSPEQMQLMDQIVKAGPTAAKAEALNTFANRGLVAGGLAAGGMAAAPYLGLDSGTTGSHLGWTGTGLGLAAALAAKGRAGQLASQASRGSTEGLNDLMRHIVTGSTDKTNASVPRDALATTYRRAESGAWRRQLRLQLSSIRITKMKIPKKTTADVPPRSPTSTPRPRGPRRSPKPRATATPRPRRCRRARSPRPVRPAEVAGQGPGPPLAHIREARHRQGHDVVIASYPGIGWLVFAGICLLFLSFVLLWGYM